MGSVNVLPGDGEVYAGHEGERRWHLAAEGHTPGEAARSPLQQQTRISKQTRSCYLRATCDCFSVLVKLRS